MIKQATCTFIIAAISGAFGFTLRGDMIYSGMYRNMMTVSVEHELPVERPGKPVRLK